MNLTNPRKARREAFHAGTTRVQLWPEHFAIPIEPGGGGHGLRASIGFSPGDDNRPDQHVHGSARSRSRDSNPGPPVYKIGALAI